MKYFSLLLAPLAFVTLTRLAPAAAAPASVTVAFNEENGSGESGTATLTDTDGGVNVVISLKGAPATAQPAHIHYGVCSDIGGVWYPLQDVTGGSSTTMVKGTTVADLLARPSAINVHESASDLGKYVACADITESKSAM